MKNFRVSFLGVAISQSWDFCKPRSWKQSYGLSKHLHLLTAIANVFRASETFGSESPHLFIFQLNSSH